MVNRQYVILEATARWTLGVEWHDFGVIFHGDVYIWGRQTAYYLRETLREWAEFLQRPVYAFVTPQDPPLKRKFILAMGFVPDHTRLSMDGERCDFFRLHHLGQAGPLARL